MEAKRLLIQDDSSWSLPALIANSVTAWKLTVCLSLNNDSDDNDGSDDDDMVSQAPFTEYLLCGGNLWTSSPFFFFITNLRGR